MVIRSFFPLALIACAALAGTASATNVRIVTNVGDVDIELFDAARPITVANFLSYVKDGSYANSFSHRMIPGFVIQGGGFRLKGTDVEAVPAKAAIKNEFNGDPRFTNAFGTITMAKVDGDVNSATNQWFINLGNNNTGLPEEGNLDQQNGGFTVFGRVTAGVGVLNLLNSGFNNSATDGAAIYNASGTLGGAFTQMPLLGRSLTTENLIRIDVYVLPPIAVRLTVPKTLRVTKKSARIAGTTSLGVSVISWRLGSGVIRKFPATASWKLNVAGLKRGRNVVTVQGIANPGAAGREFKSAPARVVIMRR